MLSSGHARRIETNYSKHVLVKTCGTTPSRTTAATYRLRPSILHSENPYLVNFTYSKPARVQPKNKDSLPILIIETVEE